MKTVTVSPKFQVVIPKAIREAMGLRPGQRLHVVIDQGLIQLVPARPRGLVAGALSRDRDPGRSEGSDVKVVDSSGWLEYVAEGPSAEFFAPAIEAPEELVVPTLSILEVFRAVARQTSDVAALQVVAIMREGRIVPLDDEIAVAAARIGVDQQLGLADSVMLATARAHDAVLLTQSVAFRGIPGVEFVARSRAAGPSR